MDDTFLHDAIAIKSIKAVPCEIAPGQTTKITAYIENRLLNIPVKGIAVELFDYCRDIFSMEETTSVGPINLSGGEIKEMSWTLRAHGTIKPEATCLKDGVKIRVIYPFETSSRTTISFIDVNEYQRRLEQHIFRAQYSDIVSGKGPLKLLVMVDDVQPIPASFNNTVLTFKIWNIGSGLLKDITVPIESIKLNSSDEGGRLANDLFTCVSKGNYGEKGRWRFIQKETPNIACLVKVPDTKGRIEFTEFIIASLNYTYELRGNVVVKVKPKI